MAGKPQKTTTSGFDSEEEGMIGSEAGVRRGTAGSYEDLIYIKRITHTDTAGG